MKKKPVQLIGQMITYSPLAGIIVASLMNITSFQRQLLILFALVWVNAFFLYKSWLSQ
jgi:hypothetical protein